MPVIDSPSTWIMMVAMTTTLPLVTVTCLPYFFVIDQSPWMKCVAHGLHVAPLIREIEASKYNLSTGHQHRHLERTKNGTINAEYWYRIVYSNRPFYQDGRHFKFYCFQHIKKWDNSRSPTMTYHWTRVKSSIFSKTLTWLNVLSHLNLFSQSVKFLTAENRKKKHFYCMKTCFYELINGLRLHIQRGNFIEDIY